MKHHEVPKYRINPSPERLLIDKLTILIILGIFLYLGIYFNYYIVSANVPQLLNSLFILGIILLVCLESILCYVKYSNYSYDFYEDKLLISKRKILEIKYSEIINMSYVANFLDKKLHTGSFILTLKDGRVVKMKYLNNPNQAFIYLQKIVKHSRLH